MNLGMPYYLGLIGAAGYQFWIVRRVDIDDPKDCAVWFRRNTWIGSIIFLGCLGEWMSTVTSSGLDSWMTVLS